MRAEDERSAGRSERNMEELLGQSGTSGGDESGQQTSPYTGYGNYSAQRGEENRLKRKKSEAPSLGSTCFI